MQKGELIERTVAEMRDEGGLLEADPEEPGGDSDDYASSVVIPTLIQRLPEGIDIDTCADFQDLQIACCGTCHRFYAHAEMFLESLPDGNTAWICCAMRTALQDCGLLPLIDSEEDLDIGAVFGYGEVPGEADRDTDE